MILDFESLFNWDQDYDTIILAAPEKAHREDSDSDDERPRKLQAIEKEVFKKSCNVEN